MPLSGVFSANLASLLFKSNPSRFVTEISRNQTRNVFVRSVMFLVRSVIMADSDSSTCLIGRRDYPDSSTVEKTAAVGDGKMAAVGGRAREGDAVTVVGRAYGHAILIYLACVFPGVADHLTDTSAVAAQQTIQQQLNAVTANMVMLSADEEKKPKSVKPKFNGESNRVKPESEQFVDLMKEVKEAVKKKKYIVAVVEEEGSQPLLLHEIETFCGKASLEAAKEVALVLKALYDDDVLEEEFIVEWYEKGLSGGNKSSLIWKNVKPFVEWLQSAESESDEE
ncbi:eukaryotic translation initiation factor 5 [Phtheirospermum japonicum]|uniref:Eukaryotic translation initiation factor 5 n=1 Tax=Phtheirospermum japonicum TaxID=374723 RepID=A0A830BRN8_9LAMI|nr:eukaryotic translation initiation factor 5 [Phtheirospermum japonicum]